MSLCSTALQKFMTDGGEGIFRGSSSWKLVNELKPNFVQLVEFSRSQERTALIFVAGRGLRLSCIAKLQLLYVYIPNHVHCRNRSADFDA